MKLSYNKLRELLPGLKLNPAELADFMTLNYAENDPHEDIGERYKDVEVAEITEITPHPDAEKLKLVKVKTTSGEIGGIITGSETLDVGQKVALVRKNGWIPGGFGVDGFIVKPREMRGEMSENVLLSEKELGIGLDHTVVMALPEDTKIGKWTEIFPDFNEVQMEIDNKALSNRADSFSHIGVARELSVLLDLTMKFEVTEIEKIGKQNFDFGDFCEKVISFTMMEAEVKNLPTPINLRSFFIASNIRPISSLVEVSNMTMAVLGQPVHVFDADKVDIVAGNNPNFGVRFAEDKEIFTTLDGVERVLSPEDLVVIANNLPVGLAGVMGGVETEVDESTTRVYVEIANFDPVSIRKTAAKFDLRSEASVRFEHGIDPLLQEKAQNYTANLLKKFSNGQNFSEIKIYEKESFEPKNVTLQKDFATKIYGFEIPADFQKDFIEKIGCKIKEKESFFIITPPSWRPDLGIPEDFAEEAGRAWGVSNIPEIGFSATLTPVKILPELKLEREINESLVGFGFDEIYTYSFADETFMKKTGQDLTETVFVPNAPKGLQNMRTSLVPNLVEKTEKNRGFYNEIKIFEMGHTYQKPENPNNLPVDEGKEEKFLGFAIGLKEKPEIVYRNVLGILKSLEQKLNIEIGSLNEISEINLWTDRDFKLKGMNVVTVEINLKNILKLKTDITMSSPREYPIVERGVNFEMKSSEKLSDLKKSLEKKLQNLNPGFDVWFEIVDVFEKENKKTVTIRFFMNSIERTLESDEVEKFIEEIS